LQIDKEREQPIRLTLDGDALNNLTTEERLELRRILWDSITDTDPDPPVPDWHIEEVACRRTAAAANPDAGIPWEHVRAEIQNRWGCPSS
jgi:putative addiction module component (TIGR02574 family)